MSKKLTQPIIRWYRDQLSHNCRFGGAYSYVYNEESRVLLDELFGLLEQIKPSGENGTRTLWLRAERGPIEDYGDAEELIADGEFESQEMFIWDWEQEFPDETAWYELSAVEDRENGYRAISLSHRLVIVQDRNRQPRDYLSDISEFVQWLVDSVKECIEMLRDGTYNGYVREHLPPQYRVGTLRRKDYWAVWPDERANFFEGTSSEDVAAFIRLATAQPKERSAFTPRLASMTAGDFFRFCALGYAANSYPIDDLSPREQYRHFADGRDEGLTDIDERSPEAFHAWLTARHGGCHPWAVCTHISLGVACDSGGYWLRLTENVVSWTIETVRFYLALCRAGVPVFLTEAAALAERLAGTELIGIVPVGVTPVHCERYFPGQHIISFMNLPEEDREQFVPLCSWQPIDEVALLRT